MLARGKAIARKKVNADCRKPKRVNVYMPNAPLETLEAPLDGIRN